MWRNSCVPQIHQKPTSCVAPSYDSICQVLPARSPVNKLKNIFRAVWKEIYFINLLRSSLKNDSFQKGHSCKKNLPKLEGNHCWGIRSFSGEKRRNENVQIWTGIHYSVFKKWPLYCPQGSGTLRQQLLMMHGIAWYSLALHCIA